MKWFYILLIQKSLFFLILISNFCCYAVSLSEIRKQTVEDYKSFYLSNNTAQLALLISYAGLLANGEGDSNFRKAWNTTISSHRLDSLAHFSNSLGKKQSLLVLTCCSCFIDSILPPSIVSTNLSRFGNNALRISVLGMPAQVLLTTILGAGRPNWTDSSWKPFTYGRGVSGHAFYLAVPFLSMSTLKNGDLWKGSWLIASAFPGLARLHTDKHYLSQVILGWGLAVIAMRQIDQDEFPQCFLLQERGGAAIGINYRW